MLGKVFVGARVSDLDTSAPPVRISRVTLRVDGETTYTAGDDTGRTLEKECPWGTQEMCESILAGVRPVSYQPFSGQDSLLDPAAEVGDGITIGGVYSELVKTDIRFDGMYSADAAAPGSNEVEDEYPYKSRARRIADRERSGTYAKITKTATQIRLEVANDLEGLSASITVELDKITQLVEDTTNGLRSEFTVALNGITARVSDAEGNIGQLQLTATLLQSQITDAVGNMSYLRQTVDSITLGVVNGQEQSTISLYKNGIAVASQNITFNGMVTFNDLNGSHGTVINGSAINTGTLRLDTLYGNTIYLRDGYGNIATEFRITGAATAANAFDLWARGVRLNTYGGDIYLKASTGYVTLSGASGVTCTNNFYPNAAGRYSCGTAYFPWSAVYATTGQISSSDREMKDGIDYDMSRYEALFDRLRPCSFLRKDGTSGRRHHGLIAQDVAAALEEAGITTMDFAGYCAWENEDGGSGCGLRYEELIAMLIYKVQKQERDIEKLRGARQ